MLNFNIGLLGHVDSGKTTLAKALSKISSTAAFDKNPQSQERGITLDLGFSSAEVIAPEHVKKENPELERVQLTFVDCPGHASLIRTIIGGAHIVDLMILVVDANHGIQTQTAECILIGEILKRKLIVVVNKIDLLKAEQQAHLEKLHTKLRKTFAKTFFGQNVPIYNISAQDKSNLQDLLDGICNSIFIPERDTLSPLVIYVDHCFSVKGHGTVCTGTVIQGEINVGDVVEIPQIKENRKVKTIQVFRHPVNKASSGDRVGIGVTQFNSKFLERGILAQPNFLKPLFAVCIPLQQIAYYKYPIGNKSKYHITLGHETVMGRVTLFRDLEKKECNIFDSNREYEFIAELAPNTEIYEDVFALIEFETATLAAPGVSLIASKLDIDAHSSSCRLAFWGCIQWITYSSQYQTIELPKFRIFKQKIKEGTIQRIINDNEIIVQDLFKKETDPNLFIGKNVQLSTGERGVIESKFGKVSKIKVRIKNGLHRETIDKLKNGKLGDVKVVLQYKKYLFHKDKQLTQ